MILTRVVLRSAGAAMLALAAYIAAPASAASLGETVAAATDRSEDDRKTDARRHPAELIDFTGIKPGMKVLDMIAGGGYTTELLARAVGPQGKVYAEVPPTTPEKPKAAFAERIKKPAMANVVQCDIGAEAPIPADVKDLDAVTLILNYHDIAYSQVDRAKMNKAVFDGLKKGGVYIIVDHAAKAGEGVTVAKTLHRIEESVVVSEVEAAGFKKAAEGNFLRTPSDPKDKPFFQMEGAPTDQFALKFVKP